MPVKFFFQPLFRKTELINADGAVPIGGADGPVCMVWIEIAFVTDGVQPTDQVFYGIRFPQTILHVFFQNVPVRLAAILVDPVRALFSAVERRILEYGFIVFLTYRIGDLTKTLMILDLIAEFLARNEGRAVCYKMVVQVPGIQVCCHYDLILSAPHTLCGLEPDLVRFLRCDLSGGKALISVVTDDLARFVKTPLGAQASRNSFHGS